MTAAADIAAAEAERDAARARLQSTLSLVKARLTPASIARRAGDDMRRKAVAAGGNAVETVRDHPAAAAGGVAALFAAGAVLFARRRKRHEAPHDQPIQGTDLAAVSSGFGHVPRTTQTLKERD